MKKILTLICLLGAIAAVAGEQLVASWDFTTGSLKDSVKGIELVPRGNCTVVNGKGLLPGFNPNACSVSGRQNARIRSSGSRSRH